MQAKRPGITDRLIRDPQAERRMLAAALRAHPASIPPQYFYDPLGCALYGAICELPEYYPTRTERAIFEEYRAEIADCIGERTQFVDLGAGDGAKAEAWLPYVAPSRYLAVDIAHEAIERTLARLATKFPSIPLHGVVTDFTAGLDLGGDLDTGPTTFFYPGSSIGNFTPEEAIEFMRSVQLHCASPGSGLLIGVDTKKDAARIKAAYDDALGVTALFNRNVLNHVNRVLASDFDPTAFAHVGLYAERESRVEMHLESLMDQVVTIDGESRVFKRGERIHTENSYKYAPDEFEMLIACAGFATVKRWQDADKDFAVFFAQ
ncbi:MAG TPA: L-histidine N(alpha)-methyltransferase [Casimicrobiaceae bacterium]|nr:L-histidine N(alpha)-methyltransferase [Casimicrobiaceae bacterium]